MVFLLRPCSITLIWLTSALLVSGAETAENIAFFEQNVRPTLDKYCYECHGEKKHKGGLRLDSKAGWEIGGDSGPALVPGDVEGSRLVKAIRYHDDDLAMPPKNRMPDKSIAALETWIRTGATDPRTNNTTKAVTKDIDWETARKHWAYRPLSSPAIPQRTDKTETPIDAFVRQLAYAEKLSPTPIASRTILLRRLYLTLTGLPPTPEQLTAFEQDPQPDAYEKQVDTLLHSRAFAERFSRHWLDVARYAESVTLRGLIYKEAWRYRDWVIDAFDRDLPYRDFVTHQIAGDLIPGGAISEQQQRLVATAFLVMGNTNLEDQDKKQLDMDFIDEQIDTLSKAFLGQTVGCARCHDHKFDPIPTADYYALAGIFRGTKALNHSNVSNWVERSLPLDELQQRAINDNERQRTELLAQINQAKKQLTTLRDNAKGVSFERPAIVEVKDLPGIVIDSNDAKAIGSWKPSQHSRRYIGDGYLHDENMDKGSKTLTFSPKFPSAGTYEVRLAYVSEINRATNVPVTILHADGESVIMVDQRKSPNPDGHFVSLGAFRFERGNQGYVMISNDNTDGHVIADAVQWLPIDDEGKDEKITVADVGQQKSIDEQRELIASLDKQLKDVISKKPNKPMALSLEESGIYSDLPIHIRGSVHTTGTVVPRGFLRVVNLTSTPTIPKDQSGRQQLAAWITAADHPLTARVMVNRLWSWVFGQGLIRTTDNFGTTGEPPSNPALLDYLASTFIANGWSMKTAIRSMVLSQTFQQQSVPPPYANDPDNRFLSRISRRVLEAEVLRDAMLSISGELTVFTGGPTWPATLKADYNYVHNRFERSIYVPIFRNAIPDAFTAFDMPDPGSVNGTRSVSTVAPQALYMLNNAFVIERARITATHLLAQPLTDDAARIDDLYRRIIARHPTASEQSLALSHVTTSAVPLPERWAMLVQALFASPDFRYLD